MRALKTVLAGVASWLVLADATPSFAKTWSLDLEGTAGRCHESVHSSLGSLDMGDITVFGGSAGVSVRLGSRWVAGIQLGWMERGFGFEQTTVFHPDGDGTFLKYKRDYIDLRSVFSYRLNTGHLFISGGAGPRLSFLVDEAEIDYSGVDVNHVVFGLDPEIRVGFGVLHLRGRYLRDTMPVYERKRDGPDAEVKDRMFTFSAGVEWPL
jgi:hypothetical protein